jgi:hypothetical protein
LLFGGDVLCKAHAQRRHRAGRHQLRAHVRQHVARHVAALLLLRCGQGGGEREAGSESGEEAPPRTKVAQQRGRQAHAAAGQRGLWSGARGHA